MYSEEDVSIKNIIHSWITMFPDRTVINDYEVQLYKGKFQKSYFSIDYYVNFILNIVISEALKWLEINGQQVCPCSMISTIKNVLHLLTDVKTKSHFTISLINGLGANLATSHRNKFLKMVRHLLLL